MLAKRLGTSRSRLYAEALDAFVQANDERSVTARMNAVLAEIEADPEAAQELEKLYDWSGDAARHVLARNDW